MTGSVLWDVGMLADWCGDAPIQLRERASEASYGRSWAGLVPLEGETTLRAYLGELQAGQARGRYLFDWSLPLNCPRLLEQTTNFTVPSYIAGDLFQVLPGASYAADSWPSLLVGPKGSGSGLHVDSHATHFWMFLLKGRKRWKVFAREEIPLLGPNYFFAGGATFAHDASGQPATHVYTVDLQPGDFLIIPYGFPHEVLNVEDSIAIAGNFVDAINLEAMVNAIKNAASSGMVQGEVEFAAALEGADLTSLQEPDLGQSGLSWADFTARRGAAAA